MHDRSSNKDGVVEQIRIQLDPDSLRLLRTYQQTEELPDLTVAAWSLLMSALIEWESFRRRSG
ncbi:MAG: hypothetical protein R3A46_14705 [Thermomicrobiales bacterium]